MAKTRSNAIANPYTTRGPTTSRVEKSVLRRGRPGRRERRIMREKQCNEALADGKTDQSSRTTPDEKQRNQPNANTATGSNTRNESKNDTAASINESSTNDKKPERRKRKSRGIPDRKYYSRPGRIEARLNNITKSMKSQLDDSFRKIVDDLSEMPKVEERVRDVDRIKALIDTRVQQHVDAQTWKLEKTQRKHKHELQRDMKAGLEATNSKMTAMETEMRTVKDEWGGVSRISKEQHRWGIRAPEPLVEDSD